MSFFGLVHLCLMETHELYPDALVFGFPFFPANPCFVTASLWAQRHPLILPLLKSDALMTFLFPQSHWQFQQTLRPLFGARDNTTSLPIRVPVMSIALGIEHLLSRPIIPSTAWEESNIV